MLPLGKPVEALLRQAQFFTPGTPSPDSRELHRKGGRDAEEFWHERWRHDRVVRSTHGVNCTGSCSWKVFVKDGIITWETDRKSTRLNSSHVASSYAVFCLKEKTR